jgi:hypothetical protein
VVHEAVTQEDRDWLKNEGKGQSPWGVGIQAWQREIGLLRRSLETWERALRGEADERAVADLEKTVNERLQRGVRLVLGWERRRGEPALNPVPVSLGGCICLQLAQTIAGNKKYRECPSCGRWRELSPGKARSDSLYCGDACRSRAYRDRKERAVQLAGEGKTPKQIAAELSSDARTVRGWLQRKEK